MKEFQMQLRKENALMSEHGLMKAYGMDSQDEVTECQVEKSMGSHHWVTVQVGRSHGEQVNELRCVYCNEKLPQ